MKMHKVSLLAVVTAGALFAFTPTIQAQDGNKAERPATGQRNGPRREAVKERLTKISEELKLTDEQKPKVEAAMKEQIESMRGVRNATPEERREKAQAARKAFDGKMKGILTADQYAKWEKLREQHRPSGPGHRGGPGADKAAKN